MKNNLIPFLLSLAVLSFSFCREKKKPEEQPQIKVESVRLESSVLELKAGEKKNLKLTITPENATNKSVQWSSDNPTVATVSSNGEVSALQSGTAVITATSDEDKSKTAACTVKVLSAYITSITFRTRNNNREDRKVFTLSPVIDNGTTTLNNVPYMLSRNLSQLSVTINMDEGVSIKIWDRPFVQGQEISFSDNARRTFVLTTKDGKEIKYTIIIPPYDVRSNPFGVYAAEDLNDIRTCLTCNYKMMNNITLPNRDADGAAATRIADYATAGWLPIGHEIPYNVSSSTNGAFSGTFDGGNFVVDNLYINRSSNRNSFTGLFGFTSNATIKNLGVSGAAQQAITGGNSVGAIAGYMVGGEVTNCFATVDVSGTNIAGGLVGKVSGGAISLCYATGNVAVSGDNKSSVGGLIGYFFPGKVNELSKCYATGNVSVSSPNSTAIGGGLVGGAEVDISHCYATGNVSCSHTSSDYWAEAGGFIGYCKKTIKVSSCYATGNASIVSSNDKSSRASGFAATGGLKIFTKCVRNKDAVMKKNNAVIESADAISPEIEGKTKKEMQEDSFTTYLNDGKAIWERSNDKNNGLPTLKGL